MKIGLISAAALFILLFIHCSPYSRPKSVPVAKEKAFDSYLLGLEAYKKGNYSDALNHVKKAIAINNHFAQFYDLEGNIYLSIGDKENALTAFYTAISYRSNFTTVLAQIGDIYFSQGKFTKAVQFFNKALSSDNSAYSIYLNLADSYLQMGDDAQALFSLKEYQRFLVQHDKKPEKRYHIIAGEIYFRLERFNDSIKELKQADSTKKVLRLLGRNYYALKDYNTGLTYFNILMNRDQSEGLWYFYRAIYFYHKNNDDDALSQFQQALRLDPTLYDAHYFIGKIYERNKEYHSAWESFRLFRESMQEKDELRYIREKVILPDDSFLID